MGVLIFFVHTALVLMMSLERNAAKLPASLLVVDFYIRRGFRIYPLAMLCVLVTFVGLVPSRPEPWPWSTFLSNLALTMNLTYSEPMWSVLWTLPLELQMYVVLPVMFLWLRRRPVVWAVGGWCMALVAAMSYTHVSSRLNVAMYAPCFVAGVLAWRLMGSVRPRWDGVWWPLAFATSWIVFLTADRRDPGTSRWLFCLALGCLLPWFRDFRWGPLVKTAHVFAKYSYGIYLSHLPIILFARSFDGPEQVLLLVGLGTLVPFALYHLVEQPMIEVGRLVVARVTARPEPLLRIPERLDAEQRIV